MAMNRIRTQIDRGAAEREVARLAATMKAVEDRLRAGCAIGDQEIANALRPMQEDVDRIREAIRTFDSAARGIMPPVGRLSDLGDVLIAVRTALGETQGQFASRLGLGLKTLREHERDGWAAVSMRRMSDAFAILPVVLDVSVRMASAEDGAGSGEEGAIGEVDGGGLGGGGADDEGVDA